MKNEKFDKDMKATIKELNALRKRVRELTESEDTPGIEGVIDFDFIVDFVRGTTEEAMIKTHGIDVYEEAKPYWDLLEWGEK